MKNSRNRGDARFIIILICAVAVLAVAGFFIVRAVKDRQFTEGEVDENYVYENRWADVRYELPAGYEFAEHKKNELLYQGPGNRVIGFVVDENSTLEEGWGSIKTAFSYLSSFNSYGFTVNVGKDTTKAIGGREYKCCVTSFSAAGQTFHMEIIARQVRKKGIIAFCFLSPSANEFEMFETNIRSYR
mgnify:CR=1 FL=1